MAPQPVVILSFDSLDSTHLEAKRRIKELDREAITLITASTQTAGRGRQGREWVSNDEENLYVTFVSFTKTAASYINACQLLALSAAEVLFELGFPITLKWPNDLMLGKKVGGVLSEIVEGALLNGIGLNLASHPEGATSLAVLKPVKKHVVLPLLTKRYTDLLELYEKEGFTPLFPRLMRFFPYKKGDSIGFHTPSGEKITALFDSIDAQGALHLRLPSGESQFFFSGDIY